MKINITSVFVDNQDKALKFYTEVLGFVKKTEVPLGEHRWLTVVPPDEPGRTELCWNRMVILPSRPFKEALVLTAFPSPPLPSTTCGGVRAAAPLNVRFTQPPLRWGRSPPPSSTTRAAT